jgi:hypothetical protein
MLRVCYYPLYTYIKTSTDPSLVVNNHDNHSKEVKVMRNELGEKFVQAINERDQKTYLECFKQRVDVN